MEEVITLVGRAPTIEHLIPEVANLLYGGFKILGFHSLGEPGIDHKERFLVLISSDGETEFDAETQESRLRHSGEYGVNLFNSLEDALEYAKEEYKLDESKAEMYAEYEEMVEEFPLVSADEQYQWMMLDAFIKLGRVQVVPAQLDGERAVAIVSVAYGPGEMNITPMAVLATPAIISKLKLPGEE